MDKTYDNLKNKPLNIKNQLYELHTSYVSKRVAHLAVFHKDPKIRKKNDKRINKAFYNLFR